MSSPLSNLNAPWVKAVLWFITGAALASAIFLAVQHDKRPQSGSQAVLRTYTVAPTLVPPLRVALEYSLRGQGTVIETGVGGQLLISAPRSIQDQIPKLFASLGKTVNKSPTLQFDIWYLAATDGPSNLDDQSLQAIRSTLEQIVKVDGPKRFEVRLRKGIRVQSGGNARAYPVVINDPRLLRRGDGTDMIAAELALDDPDRTAPLLKTQVEVAPGETLVIGQTTSKAKDHLESTYQIVRASL
jgi:hypothetical protein